MKILPDVLDSEGSADMEGRLEAVVEGYLIEEPGCTVGVGLEIGGHSGEESRSGTGGRRQIGGSRRRQLEELVEAAGGEILRAADVPKRNMWWRVRAAWRRIDGSREMGATWEGSRAGLE